MVNGGLVSGQVDGWTIMPHEEACTQLNPHRPAQGPFSGTRPHTEVATPSSMLPSCQQQPDHGSPGHSHWRWPGRAGSGRSTAGWCSLCGTGGAGRCPWHTGGEGRQQVTEALESMAVSSTQLRAWPREF